MVSNQDNEIAEPDDDNEIAKLDYEINLLFDKPRFAKGEAIELGIKSVYDKEWWKGYYSEYLKPWLSNKLTDPDYYRKYRDYHNAKMREYRRKPENRTPERRNKQNQHTKEWRHRNRERYNQWQRENYRKRKSMKTQNPQVNRYLTGDEYTDLQSLVVAVAGDMRKHGTDPTTISASDAWTRYLDRAIPWYRKHAGEIPPDKRKEYGARMVQDSPFGVAFQIVWTKVQVSDLFGTTYTIEERSNENEKG